MKSQPFTNCYSAIAYCDNAKIRYVVFSSLVLLKLADCLCLGLFFFFSRCPGSRDGRLPERMAMPVEPPSLKLWTVSCHRLVQLTNLCVCLFKMSTKLAVCVLCNASRLPATGSAWDRNTVVCPRAFFLKWRMYSTCLKWFFVGFFFCKGMNSLS